ncbi:unnamed protein product, partial [Meganyctiphanes norvegica]
MSALVHFLVECSDFIRRLFLFVFLATSGIRPRTFSQSQNYLLTGQILFYLPNYSHFGTKMIEKYIDKIQKIKSAYLYRKMLLYDSKTRGVHAFVKAVLTILLLERNPNKTLMSMEFFNKYTYLPVGRLSSDVRDFFLSGLACMHAKKGVFLRLNSPNFDTFKPGNYNMYQRATSSRPAMPDYNMAIQNSFKPKNEKLRTSYSLQKSPSYLEHILMRPVIIYLSIKAYPVKRDAVLAHRASQGSMGGPWPPNRSLRDIAHTYQKSNMSGFSIPHTTGLGRTGSLIGCYVMKHFRFTAAEIIAWLRICRPGSIIGGQQQWLTSKQSSLWLEGDIFRGRNKNQNLNRKFDYGIYSIKWREYLVNMRNENNINANNMFNQNEGCSSSEEEREENVRQVLDKVDDLKLDDQNTANTDNQNKYIEDMVNSNRKTADSEIKVINGLSQGDRLNQLKHQRAHARSATTGRVHLEDKAHVRTKSTPLGGGVGSVGGGGVPSPVKAGKVSSLTSAAHAARDSQRRPIRATNTATTKRHAWLLGSVYRGSAQRGPKARASSPQSQSPVAATRNLVRSASERCQPAVTPHSSSHRRIHSKSSFHAALTSTSTSSHLTKAASFSCKPFSCTNDNSHIHEAHSLVDNGNIGDVPTSDLGENHVSNNLNNNILCGGGGGGLNGGGSSSGVGGNGGEVSDAVTSAADNVNITSHSKAPFYGIVKGIPNSNPLFHYRFSPV